MMSEERKKALDIALSQIEKNFGKGSVMKLGEVGHVSVDSIPTGAPFLFDITVEFDGKSFIAALGQPNFAPRQPNVG